LLMPTKWPEEHEKKILNAASSPSDLSNYKESGRGW
jgi:hypothetical protein